MTRSKLILAFAFSGFLFACGQAPNANAPVNNSPVAASTPQPANTRPVDVSAKGRDIYLTNCAVCHKETGRGGKMEIEGKSISPDDLTSDKIKGFSDEKIYGYIHNGIEDEGMPAFKDKLSEAKIREVVRFLRTDIQKMPPAAESTRR